MLKRFLRAMDKKLYYLDSFCMFCQSIPRAFLFPIIGIDACCTIVSLWGNGELDKLTFINRKYFDAIIAHWPDAVEFLSADIGQLFFILISIVLVLILIFRYFYRKPALLVAHSTMGHDISCLATSFRKKYFTKKASIIIEFPKDGITLEQLANAIKIQDDIYRSKIKTDWRSTIYYYGVAHTPLVFRLGFNVGQTKHIMFLHRFRHTENAQEFIELAAYDDDQAAFIVESPLKTSRTNSRSTELVVAIGTTYPILDENIETLGLGKDKLVYKVQLDKESYGFDFFKSYHKIRSYADRIVSDIRDIVKTRHIKKIHMVLSTSVPFTFYLAQQMNTNQFPSIVVYHFSNGRYVWGINAQEEADKAVIILG